MRRFLIVGFLFPLLLPAVGEETQDIGAWEYLEHTDPMDDTMINMISVSSNEKADSGQSTAELSIACGEGKDGASGLFMYIHWYLLRVGEGPIRVKHRIGEHVAETRQWTTQNFDTTSYPLAFAGNLDLEPEKRVDEINNNENISLLKEMMGESQFLVRVESSGLETETVTVSFDISGIEIAIQPIIKLCNVEFDNLIHNKVRWEYIEQTDPMEDTMINGIRLSSNEKDSSGNYSADLVIACMDIVVPDSDIEFHGLHMKIDWNVASFHEKGPINVRHRIGEQDAETREWVAEPGFDFTSYILVVSDNLDVIPDDRMTAVGAINNKGTAFLNNMMGESQFLVRVESAGLEKETVTVSFDISGIENVIKPVIERCNVVLHTLAEDKVDEDGEGEKNY